MKQEGLIDIIKFIAALITAGFVILQCWSKFIDGQVAKAKEQSAGSEKIKEFDRKLDELKEDYAETLKLIRDVIFKH